MWTLLAATEKDFAGSLFLFALLFAAILYLVAQRLWEERRAARVEPFPVTYTVRPAVGFRPHITAMSVYDALDGIAEIMANDPNLCEDVALFHGSRLVGTVVIRDGKPTVTVSPGADGRG